MEESDKKKRKEFSTTQVIALGFFVTVLIGTILLSLPVSSADNTFTPVVDSLFTATTSVCVTGLVVVPTYAHWSLFGKIVILILIQCGGIGIVSLTTAVMLILGKKVSLKSRLLLEDALNLNTMSGLVKFLIKVLKGTFLVEGLGAIGYAFVFVPEYGLKGIWYSVFHAVSAFCNAGIDILGDFSLMEYAMNPVINFVTMALIVSGGLGFIVWFDVLDVLGMYRRKDIKRKDIFRKLSLHSKIAVTFTAALIFGGALLIFLCEYNNPETIGDMSFGGKIMAAVFQSVTLRTAGFFTVSQKGLTDATVLISLVLMFIGGSPVGTAGGVKTVTAALVMFTTASIIRGREDVTAFKRTISLKLVRKSLAVILISLFAVFSATILVSLFNGGDFVDIVFEVTSAVATVGLSRDLTASLNLAGKIIIIICMYLGRIGPISMAIAFGYKKSGRKGLAVYPSEDVSVG